jgi:hypothetical protein
VNQTLPQPDLMNLALVARTRPGFVAGPLFAYQASLHLTTEQLTFIIGVCVEQLSHLALCHWPHSEEDSAAIAKHTQADIEKLRVWPKEQKG